MRVKLIGILLCFSLASFSRADTFDLSRIDTLAHFSTAYAVTLTGTLVLQKVKVSRWKACLLATGATLVGGLIKERFIDSEFSTSDMMANALGAGISVAAVFVFDF